MQWVWRALLMALCGVGAMASEPAWRSALYPVDWQPGRADASGRRLQDWSFAGYRGGEAPLPRPEGPVFDATHFGADPRGEKDSTGAIQQALDAAGAAGGGVVLLPEGDYLVAPAAGAESALWLRHDGVVLRGAGAGRTRLINTETQMRQRSVIRIAPARGGSWLKPLDGSERRLARDGDSFSSEVTLAEGEVPAPGTWVVLTTDVTREFVAEHAMEGGGWEKLPHGPLFFRRVETSDAATGAVRLHAPLRSTLRVRDGARLYRVAPPLREVGLEKFSLGMREHPGTPLGDVAEQEFGRAGTPAFAVHDSYAVRFQHVLDGWMRDVSSFRPPGNRGPWHLLSNGVRMTRSARLTLERVEMSWPQYRGSGGNGYGITLDGADCLVRDCRSEQARHTFSFKGMHSTGNVLLRPISLTPRYALDFHQWLSAANLIDGAVLQGDWIDAQFRPFGGSGAQHGQTTTESVFWNTTVPQLAPGATWGVLSFQWGHGYVIGTSGEGSRVATAPTFVRERRNLPEDWVEGEGAGVTLEPVSLYEDQVKRRLTSGAGSR